MRPQLRHGAQQSSPLWERRGEESLPSGTLQDNTTSTIETGIAPSGLRTGNSTVTPNLPGDVAASSDDHMSVKSLMISIIAVVLVFWCALPRSEQGRSSREAARRRRERQALRQRNRRENDTPQNRERRAELVNRSLWVQKVIKEEGQQLTLGPPDADTLAPSEDGEEHDNDSHSRGRESIDSYGEEVSTCIICLEPFRVGDVVAWSKDLNRPASSSPSTPRTAREEDSTQQSPASQSLTSTVDDSPGYSTDDFSPTCKHVFHKDCIASWLQNPKHDDCPACRVRIVYEPPKSSNRRNASIQPCDSDDCEEEDDPEQGGLSSMAFVVVRGLVSRARRASYTLIGASVHADLEDLDDSDDDAESFEDEHSNVGMEMVAPASSKLSPSTGNRHLTPLGRAAANTTRLSLPLESPLRRVASSGGDRKPQPLLRRRSFGSMKSVDDRSGGVGSNSNSIGGLSAAMKSPPFGGGGLPPPAPLRRTLSAGTVVCNTSEGSITLHVKPEAPIRVLPSLSPRLSTRPVWSPAAERALSQTLEDRLHSAARPSPLSSRRVVSMSGSSATESPGAVTTNSNSSPRAHRKVFRKQESLEDQAASNSSSSAMPPSPPLSLSGSRTSGRRKSGYSLLPTATASSSQPSSSSTGTLTHSNEIV